MKRSQLLAMVVCALASGAATAESGTTQSTSARTGTEAATFLVGTWEGEAETKKWPLFQTLRVRRGEDGLTGAIDVLGRTIPASAIEVAGDKFTVRIGSNLALEGRRQGDTLVGHLKEGKAELPFTLRRVPDYPKPQNRVEAWAQDLDALEKRFLLVDRSFSPGERALFVEALSEIRAELPNLTDAEVTMKMASAIALANNPHTRLYLLRNATELRRMPIRLWWFRDGLYVVRATKEHANLLGCRVETIGGRPARIARDMVAPAFAGTPSWVDYKSVYSLTSPEALQGLGVTRNLEQVEYGLSGCRSAGSVTIKPLPLQRTEDSVEAWWDLSPLHPGPGAGWVQVLEPARNKLPLYLRNPTRNYWFEYRPDSGILYFQYNRSSDAADEKTSAFGERLLAELDRHPVKALVIDYRFNTGGNLTLGADLMKKLQERTRGLKRFIITGRSTFSAGITHVASWREAGNVTIVGEPVGDGMEFWSEGGNIKLPNSGYDAHFANGRHSYSPAPCPEGIYCYDINSPSLDPDVLVSATWAEYQSGTDPAMVAITHRLRHQHRRKQQP